MRTDPNVRFERFVDRVSSDRGCWLYTGGLNHKGYGIFKSDRRVYAHRFAYEAVKGPIPKGLEIDHRCRTRTCVNPNHLDAVSHAENLRRGNIARGGKSGKHSKCRSGHLYNSENDLFSDPPAMLRYGGGRRCRKCAVSREARNNDRRRITRSIARLKVAS